VFGLGAHVLGSFGNRESQWWENKKTRRAGLAGFGKSGLVQLILEFRPRAMRLARWAGHFTAHLRALGVLWLAGCENIVGRTVDQERRGVKGRGIYDLRFTIDEPVGTFTRNSRMGANFSLIP
jgi:hypothetical protein